MNGQKILFDSWPIEENGNVSEVQAVVLEKVSDVAHIRLRKDALQYCKGASDIHLRIHDNGAEETYEGPCIFSFFQESEKEAINTQVFSLYKYGETCPEKELLAARMSKWEKGNDLARIRKNEKPVNPTCCGITSLLNGSAACEILSACQEICKYFYMGLSYTRRKDSKFLESSLKVEDSFGITHEMNWDNKTQFHLLEKAIDEVIARIKKEIDIREKIDAKITLVFH